VMTSSENLFRDPIGLPAGFPDCPGCHGVNCFGTVETAFTGFLFT
jgi:hypothetical protein